MRYLILTFLIIVSIILLSSLVFSYLVIETINNGNAYNSDLIYDDIKFSLVCVVPQVLSISIITFILFKKKIIKF